MSSKWLYHSQRWYKQQLVVQRYYMNKDKHIPQGYKNSPLGIIPKEWKVKRLGEVCDYVDYRGKSPNKSSEGIFLITAKNIREGYIDYEVSKEYIPEEDYAEVMRRGKAEVGDVLITTEAPLGHVAQIDTPYVALAQRVLKYRGKEVIENTFLKYFLMSEIFQKILIANATGSTALGIKGSRLHQLPIIIPSITEQSIITTILCLWDTAIEKQSELIEKLTLRKRALMQQLLTGKKRLAGFSGEWKKTKLGKIADVIGGGTPNTEITDYWEGNISWFTPTEIGTSKYVLYSKRTISNNGLKNSSARKLPIGTILFTSRATIGAKAILLKEATTNQGFQSIVVSNGNNNEFVYYYLDIIQKKIKQKASGSTFQEVSAGSIRKIDIVIPSLEEQNSIASILINADKEIDLAKEKLASLQSQKRGLMQQLLTGKKRVG